MVVFGQHYLGQGDRRRAVLAEALIDCRAPVLVARGSPDRLSGVAAIAWDGSLQAGRAVRAALPLLATASRIVVVQQASGLDRLIANPDVGRLGLYLAAHGLPAPEAVTAGAGDEGRALLDAARSHGADLFVAGAYGHTRFRERVLGGATRSFLDDAGGPCLILAH